MKAVVLKSPKQLEYMDVPRPKLAAENQVLIKVEACGICGSDLRYWAGENPWALHTLGKHVDNPPNIILGHEFAGVVEKVNSQKHEHLLGKRVGVQTFRVCGKCDFCRNGRENLCRRMIHIGHAQGWGVMDYYPGGYAEYCLGWADLLHPIPDNISFAQAAMADILCVAVHAVGRTNIYNGATILCIGGGPAGLAIAQTAKAKGAENIYISDPSPVARQVLESYPDFVVLDPNEQHISDIISPSTCAANFDSVGSADTTNLALPLLEESGVYVNLAVHSTNVTINALTLGSERTMTTSSNAFYSDLEGAFRLLFSGAVDVTPWITHRFPLHNCAKAFELLLQNPKAAYKVVFEPQK